jgi:hypothetical protein
MIAILGWLAALVAAMTGLAMLQDATTIAPDRSARGWLRHVVRLVLLIGITASSAVLLVIPALHASSLYEVALRCCLAGYLASSAPCPWWRYVFKGQGAARIERRRVL